MALIMSIRALIFISLCCVQLHHATQALQLQQNMDENCVLSFVVPRDKMKSSCNVEEKFRRRISSMEMKVNVYKQQLNELQIQLSKERELNAGKFDNLERQAGDSSRNADINIRIERRLALLEQEVGQLSNEIVRGRGIHIHNRNAFEDHPDYNFNALDKNPVTLPNLVKSMVQAELETVLDDYTKNFESYVQEQILIHNKVYTMISEPRGKTASYDKARLNDKPATPGKYPEKHRDAASKSIMNQLSEFKDNLDKTGRKITENVHSYLREEKSTSTKMNSNQPIIKENDEKYQINKDTDRARITTTSTTATSTTATTTDSGSSDFETTLDTSNGSTEDYEELQLSNTSEIVMTEDNGLEVNDSFSGENPDSNETSTKPIVFTKKTDKDITEGASSRISSGVPGKNKTSATSYSSKEKYDENNTWKENMVMDQNYDKAREEEKLMEKVRLLLYQPLAEMMSLVEKQNAHVTDQLKVQEEVTHKMAKDFEARMKTADQGIERNSLQLESISQAVQDLYVKTDKMKTIEATLNELKENTSSTQSDMPMTVHDHEKRVKKLERLMGVYRQSLDHYKNETKQEYKGMRETLMKETIKVKLVSKTLQKNITGAVDKIVNQYNESQFSQIIDIKTDIRSFEDKLLLKSLDMSILNRTIKNKGNKMERDLAEIRADLRDNMEYFNGKNRDIKRKTESLNQKVGSLELTVNATSKIISDLKTEVKLTMTDEWLEINFDYNGSRSGCFGKQYVKKSKFKKVGFVGVVLCSPKRYKILLGNTLDAKFMNIGDSQGFGKDHCEFVGATSKNKITIPRYKPDYGSVRGYARADWGQEPRMTSLNAMKPTSKWYECGVTIP